MSLKHYDYRKPHLTSAFEILEADFEMQEEDEYQSYYKYWHNDPYSYYAYDLQNDNIAEGLLGELYPLYKELKESFCDKERFGISYDFNKRINFKDYKFSVLLSISYGFEYSNAPCKKYYVNYSDLDYEIKKSSDALCIGSGSKS